MSDSTGVRRVGGVPIIRKGAPSATKPSNAVANNNSTSAATASTTAPANSAVATGAAANKDAGLLDMIVPVIGLTVVLVGAFALKSAVGPAITLDRPAGASASSLQQTVSVGDIMGVAVTLANAEEAGNCAAPAAAGDTVTFHATVRQNSNGNNKDAAAAESAGANGVTKTLMSTRVAADSKEEGSPITLTLPSTSILTSVCYQTLNLHLMTWSNNINFSDLLPWIPRRLPLFRRQCDPRSGPPRRLHARVCAHPPRRLPRGPPQRRLPACRAPRARHERCQ